MKKSIYDCTHVKGVKAVALLKGGKEVGKIVANFSDNPAGSVCTAVVWLYDQPKSHGTGKAGGYGYDKFSAAVHSALREMDLIPEKENLHVLKVPGKIAVYSGAGNVQAAFEAAGYTYINVI